MFQITKRTQYCESPAHSLIKMSCISFYQVSQPKKGLHVVKGGASLAQLVECQTLDCKVAS